jgi:sulfur-oxidizing protein SoxZ
MEMKAQLRVPATAKKGDAMEIKTVNNHLMETGLRHDDDGKLIPRLICNKFICKFEGEEVISADLMPSVSEKPYFGFFVTATKTGTFEFTWIDDEGSKLVETRKVTVT